jgi:hypothetical protein
VGGLLITVYLFRKFAEDLKGSDVDPSVSVITIMVVSYSPEFDEKKRLIRKIQGATETSRIVLERIRNEYLHK